ncbi:MAG: methylated-DNA-[protein]-cysteine S-methyltransferase [Candidatus Paceibacteria bacterium]|jgi:methylated-DNA-[protein]-cysteine S-methyltransferase
MTNTYLELDSPIGRLLIVANSVGIEAIHFESEGGANRISPLWNRGGSLVEKAAGQLSEYFAGEREEFDLPLAPQGTEFMHSVWNQLSQIPYGQTTNYGAIAMSLGKPTAARAIGSANGKNPIPIVVPCHRVIGADGSLTGFAGGIETKRQLLELEGLELACNH